MAETVRIRAKMEKDVADVKLRITHAMETGLRRNERNELVPLHFIQSVVASHNGRAVFDVQWSQAISRNPFLGFRIKGAKPGDKVNVFWTDNRGGKGSVETTVLA